MAIGFVVQIHYRTLRISLGGIGHEPTNRLGRWAAQHAKFRDEPAHEFLPQLILLLRSVPDIPLMDVADSAVLRAIPSPRGARMVWDCRRVFRDHGGQMGLVEGSRGKVRVRPVARMVFWIPIQLEHLRHGVVLVVAGVQDNRAVLAQPFHLIGRFPLHRGRKLRIARVLAAGEHEVLPHQDSLSVTLFV